MVGTVFALFSLSFAVVHELMESRNSEQLSRTQLYSRPRNVSSFSSCGNGYGFLDDSGVVKIDGRRLTQHLVSAGVANVARVAVDIAPAMMCNLTVSPWQRRSVVLCRHRNSIVNSLHYVVVC